MHCSEPSPCPATPYCGPSRARSPSSSKSCTPHPGLRPISGPSTTSPTDWLTGPNSTTLSWTSTGTLSSSAPPPTTSGKSCTPRSFPGPAPNTRRLYHDLLIARGVTEELARFARSHASWNAPGVSTDDLLVSLADKVWKGKRVTDLEQLLIERLSETSHQRPWEAFVALDDVLDQIAQDAERRLAFQAEHPAAPGIG